MAIKKKTTAKKPTTAFRKAAKAVTTRVAALKSQAKSKSTQSVSTMKAVPALPRVGQMAPTFTLSNHDGKMISLSSLKGRKFVLYFYPRDDTPGCTIEARGFNDAYVAFQKRGVIVFGVSKDDAKSHCKFRDKYGLAFPLLSDATGKAVEAYGCWVEKSLYGRKYMGIRRATFLIDEKGTIAHVWPDVTPDGHAKAVLGAL